MRYADYIKEVTFDGQQRIEAGYCDAPCSMSNGTVFYPVNRAGCEMLARWCLTQVRKADNKYERWKWQMSAANWYRRAAAKAVAI